MRRNGVEGLCAWMAAAVLCLAGCGVDSRRPESGVSSPATEVWWPIYRGDSTLSGVAEGTGPQHLVRRWTARLEGPVVSSPVLGHGLVVVGSATGVHAFELAHGASRWTHTTDAPVEAPPLLVDDLVVVGTLGGRLVALELQSGEPIWSYEADGKIVGSVNDLPADAAGEPHRLLVGSHDSAVHCVDLRTGAGLWRHRTTSYINGTPAVVDRTVVFGGCDGMLHLADVASGSTIHEIEVGSYVAGSPAVFENTAYLGTYAGVVRAIALDTGRTVWVYEPDEGPEPLVASPAVTDQLVVVGSRDGRVHAIDREHGSRQWISVVGGAVDGSPVVLGNQVLVASDDGWLCGLSLVDGGELWSVDVGSPIVSTPAVNGGWLVVAGEDGRLTAFTMEVDGARSG